MSHVTFRDGGSIAYSLPMETVRAASGLFSLCFYFRDMLNYAERPINNRGLVSDKRVDYLRGLYMYSQIVKQEPFLGWKCVFYTDQYTHSLLQTIVAPMTDVRDPISRLSPDTQRRMAQYIEPLLHDTDVVFAVVDMPTHQRRPDIPQINGFVLRTARYRALFDFPLLTVCIRDADTYFSMNTCGFSSIQENGVRERDCSEHYRKWEAAFLDSLKNEPHPLFVVGTSYTADFPPKLYWRAWHQNKPTGRRTPFGVLAGFINVLQDPVNPTVLFPLSVWDEFMDYIAARSVRTDRYTSRLLNMMQANNSRLVKPSNTEAAAYKMKKIETALAYGKAPPEKIRQYWNSAERDKKYAFTNDKENERIGRDEQFPVFFLMPHALPYLRIYIIKFDDIEMPRYNKEKSQALRTLFTKTVEHGFQMNAWKEGDWLRRPSINVLALNSNTLEKAGPFVPNFALPSLDDFLKKQANKGGRTRRRHKRRARTHKRTH